MINVKILSRTIFIFLIIGCATTKEDWQKAESINTEQSYKEFLKKHPNSDFFSSEAIARIEKFDWEKVQQLDTIRGYKSFIQQHLNSKFVNDARKKLAILEWEKAKKLDTADAYKQFVEVHKNFSLEYVDNKFLPEAYKNICQEFPEVEFCQKAVDRFLEAAKNGNYFQVSSIIEDNLVKDNNTMTKALMLALQGMAHTKIIMKREVGGTYMYLEGEGSCFSKNPNDCAFKKKSNDEKNAYVALIRQLLEQRADPNAMVLKGFKTARIEKGTGFDRYEASRDGKIVDLKNGGLSALQVAKQLGRPDLVKLLIEHGAK